MKTEIDSHRFGYHPRRVADWLEGEKVYPIYVEAGLTNRCNNKCVFCALDWISKDKTDINRASMLSALEDMAQNGVKSIMFAGEGEPFLHRDAPLFVQHAKKCGLDVAVTTNGSVFDEEKAKRCLPYLSWIRFSVDAGTNETYSKVHGTTKENFDKVLANITRAADIKKRNKLDVTIGLQALLIPQNVDEIELLARLAKEIGADNLQVKPYSQHPLSKNKFSVDHASLEGLEQRLSKLNDKNFQVLYRTDTMKRIEEGISYKKCYGLSFFTLIDSKGNVMPCNLYYDNPRFFYGNLYKNTFSEIWQGKQRQKVLSLLNKNGTEKCRYGCRLDAGNRYLAKLKNPPAHVNFI